MTISKRQIELRAAQLCTQPGQDITDAEALQAAAEEAVERLTRKEIAELVVKLVKANLSALPAKILDDFPEQPDDDGTTPDPGGQYALLPPRLPGTIYLEEAQGNRYLDRTTASNAQGKQFTAAARRRAAAVARRTAVADDRTDAILAQATALGIGMDANFDDTVKRVTGQITDGNE